MRHIIRAALWAHAKVWHVEAYRAYVFEHPRLGCVIDDAFDYAYPE